jgi:hypothetical protein
VSLTDACVNNNNGSSIRRYLSDIGSKERLTLDEFTLARFLVHRWLAGIKLPPALSLEFIPYSSRHNNHPRAAPGECELSSDAPLQITPEILETATELFAVLDFEKEGVIDQTVLRPFLKESRLPVEDLQRIWDLADAGKKGRLDEERFIFLFVLVHRRLGGLNFPDTGRGDADMSGAGTVADKAKGKASALGGFEGAKTGPKTNAGPTSDSSHRSHQLLPASSIPSPPVRDRASLSTVDSMVGELYEVARALVESAGVDG